MQLEFEPVPVSTHSRPKAAGCGRNRYLHSNSSFNSQPPEGGWEGEGFYFISDEVSTHSRPKAAGPVEAGGRHICRFNSQPPEGGWHRARAIL